MHAPGAPNRRYAIAISGWIPCSFHTISNATIPNSRLNVKLNKVPMNVIRATRTGIPYQCGERGALRVAIDSCPALVEDRELEPAIGRKQFSDLAQSLGQSGWC